MRKKCYFQFFFPFSCFQRAAGGNGTWKAGKQMSLFFPPLSLETRENNPVFKKLLVRIFLRPFNSNILGFNTHSRVPAAAAGDGMSMWAPAFQ